MSKTPFSQRLRELREARQYTQEEAAARARITSVTWCRLETGKTAYIRTFYKIVCALDLQKDEIIDLLRKSAEQTRLNKPQPKDQTS